MSANQSELNAAFHAALRVDLRAFTEKVFYTLNPGTLFRNNWHIGAMTTTLEKVARAETRRQLITIAPRHLKSTVVTVAFTAWLLGNNPTKRIITASYSADLSLKHAHDTRKVMREPWFRETFPELVLDKDTESVLHTTQSGYRYATSVGGSITGFGGDILILDDPMKASDAASESERKRVKEWFDSEFTTRLDDPQTGAIVVIMQRLHEDDLAGHLLSKGGHWTHLCIPAVAPLDIDYDVEGEPYCFRKGDVLDPNRMPLSLLEEKRKELGSFAYSAQYLQEPVPEGGNLFRWEWLKSFDLAQIDLAQVPYVFQAWDVAATTSSTNDYSVCTTWGVFERNNLRLLDVLRVQEETPNLLRLAAKHYDDFLPDVLLVEKNGLGAAFWQLLREERGERILSASTKADKNTRAAGVSAMLERGWVLVPRAAPWLDSFRREFNAFPAARNDDQVDSMILFVERLEALIARANQLGRISRVGPRIEPRNLPVVTVTPIGSRRFRPISQLEGVVRQHLGMGW